MQQPAAMYVLTRRNNNTSSCMQRAYWDNELVNQY